MPVAVAFCPCPPLLVPELAAGAAEELDALRTACDTAVGALLATGPSCVSVLAGAAVPQEWDAGAGGSLQSYGVDVRAGGPSTTLPSALTIGAWLLDRSGWTGPRRYVGVRDAVPAGDVREAWLVVGDGSARRTPTSPGSFDPRAEGFDTAVARALADGDAAALAVLDRELAEQLWCSGVRVWRAVGAALKGRTLHAEPVVDQAPYGVGYLVAGWRVHD